MNYIAQLNAFDKWLEENYLPARSQLLWYRLSALNNRFGWVEWMQVDNLKLMALIGVGREQTIIDVRDKLIESGLVLFQKGKKGRPSKYKMLPIYEFTGNTVVQSVAQTVANTVVQSVANTVDIYKLKQKDNIAPLTPHGEKEKDADVVGAIFSECETFRGEPLPRWCFDLFSSFTAKRMEPALIAEITKTAISGGNLKRAYLLQCFQNACDAGKFTLSSYQGNDQGIKSSAQVKSLDNYDPYA